MKKAILSTFFIFAFIFASQAQLGDCGNCGNANGYDSEKPPGVQVNTTAKKKKVSVYPNPAVNYIGLSDSEDVKELKLFNVMGREVATFKVQKGEKYDVSDLRKGMYLVRIVDTNNKIITTQRLNKR